MIKLIRMKSGEDVIGDVTEIDTGYIVEKPAVLMPMPASQGREMSMGMVPWQPFSKSTKFSIPGDWVVTTSDPADDIENGYRTNYGSGIQVATNKLLVD
jgi:hypothetical protein